MQNHFDNLEFELTQAKKAEEFSNPDYILAELIEAVLALKARLDKQDQVKDRKALAEYELQHRSQG